MAVIVIMIIINMRYCVHIYFSVRQGWNDYTFILIFSLLKMCKTGRSKDRKVNKSTK